jgi:phage terminase large subunit GpA-like protein
MGKVGGVAAVVLAIAGAAGPGEAGVIRLKSSVDRTVGRLFEGASKQPYRTMRRFAEDEIVLPNGPAKGERYRCEYMPFSSELFAEFDGSRFSSFFGSGPAQAGKTLHFVVIPVMYHLFEIGEDVILGAPTVELAKAVYKDKILPVIEKSRYEDVLPGAGSGSKGGTPDMIRFRNGAKLRFIGAGGKDAQRSSHTARVVAATELDKMGTAGDSSEEADPVSQLIARTKSFPDPRFYGECTMSTPQGRIYREVVKFGTDSKVMLRCPRCLVWIWPQRGGLVGWQEAVDEVDAKTSARFQCPRAECRGFWTEDQRLEALREPRVVARGQEVGTDGVIRGDLPRTSTYGFRWNAMASPMRSIPGLAAAEWKAQQSTDEGEEKSIVQFDWAEPWENKTEDLNRPDVATVMAKRVEGWARKFVPPETVRLTMGVDVGSYVVWYLLMAWFKDGRGHIVDWGGITVYNPDGVLNRMNVMATLRDLRDRVIKPGWGARGADHPLGPAPGRQPEKVIVDAGYESDVVYAFVLESGEPRYLASKGYGSNKDMKWTGLQAQKSNEAKVVDQEWRSVKQPAGVRLIIHHADHWKARIHDGLQAAIGAPGSITIPEGSVKDPDLKYLARQLVAEERTMKAVAGHESKVVWVRKHVQNHWLDCGGMACCGADIEGVKVVRPKIHVLARRPTGRPSDAQMDPSRLRKIRTKY